MFASRNFYGVLRVQDAGAKDLDHRRTLIHGTIMHGKQYLRPELQQGADELLHAHVRHRPADRGDASAPRADQGGRHRPGHGNDRSRTAARATSTASTTSIPASSRSRSATSRTSSDSDATIELALGDARLSLEREPPQHFDVLAIDAFSSDAIPVHLITKEAVEVYLRHMKPDGVIAFHVTNRYLNLVPVVEGIAQRIGPARPCGSRIRASIRWPIRRAGCCCPGSRAPERSAPDRSSTPASKRAATGACGPTISTTWCRC